MRPSLHPAGFLRARRALASCEGGSFGSSAAGRAYGRAAVRRALLLVLVVGSAAACGSADRVAGIRVPERYDGLYYMFVSTGEQWPDASLVISHDGNAVPPKSNDPDAPTVPGFYTPWGPGERRYVLDGIVIQGSSVAFSTALKDGTRFSFHGAVAEESDPELSLTYPVFIGQLEISGKGKRVEIKRVKFFHAIVA